MTSFFGSSSRANKPVVPATQLRIQSSAQGLPIAMGWGKGRLAGNLIWYGDFTATAVQSSSAGGKGGPSSGGGKGGGTTSYNYSAAVVIALCEGPVAAILQVWSNNGAPKPVAPLAGGTKPNLGSNFVGFLGTYTQQPWSYLTTKHPGSALAFRGIAYAAAGPLQLGSNPSLPNLNFEVLFGINTGLPGIPDANPADVIVDLATNAHYGLGFPGNRIGDNNLDTLRQFCRAAGLLVSPILTAQQQANQLLGDLAVAAGFEFVWSGGALKAVPYWDQPIAAGTQFTVTGEPVLVPQSPGPYTVDVTGAQSFVSDQGVSYAAGGTLARVAANPQKGQYSVAGGLYAFSAADAGASVLISFTWQTLSSFTPNVTPVYDLGPDDFQLANQPHAAPVCVTQKGLMDTYNDIKIEYLDRANNYNPTVFEIKDDAEIQSYKIRPRDKKQLHLFCYAPAAQLSAAMQLGREKIINSPITVTLPAKYFLLEPMDIVTLTEPNLGMARFPVRIKEITENSDFTLTCACEELLVGSVSPPAYGAQLSTGAAVDINAAAGNVQAPLFFEPTDQLAGELAVWGAVCGPAAGNWGGADIWVSFDNQTYAFVERQLGPSRYGILTAPLPGVTAAVSPPTIDNASTLAIDISASGAQLASGTLADALALTTACYVDGEIVAYTNATPTGTGLYNLTNLVRGAYGTSTATTHAAGSRFARLDQGIFKIPFNQGQIGQTIYVKFLSFNPWGGGQQQLSDVSPYAYVLQGSALSSPLPNVTNIRANFEGGVMKVWWDEIKDFRPVAYEIRKGTTYAGSLLVDTRFHPPFTAFGDDTYWVMAISQPVAGLIVKSSAPQSIAIAGALLTQNVVVSRDEQASGWTGTFDNGVGKDGNNIRLGGSGNILTDASILTTPDILDYGGIIASGYYTIPASERVNVGYVANLLLGSTWVGTGSPVGQNVLSIADFLNDADVLGAASAAFVDVHPEIRIAQANGVYGAWQKLVPGTYLGQSVDWRMYLGTVDPATIAYCLAWKFSASVAARLDHYLNQTVPAGGLAIVFKPDTPAGGAAQVASPFNGGPNSGNLPAVSVNWQNQSGDTLVITGLTLSGVTVQIQNGGVGVQRTGVNILVEGY